MTKLSIALAMAMCQQLGIEVTEHSNVDTKKNEFSDACMLVNNRVIDGVSRTICVEFIGNEVSYVYRLRSGEVLYEKK